jgi:glutamate--cysteine ligase
MLDTFAGRLERLRASGRSSALRGGLVGLERETLRVRPDGSVAQTPHPPGLGAALTHRSITTDFSEALLEFVTPPFSDVSETLAFLEHIHRFVHARVGDELLWPTSMPCRIDGEESIPIARFGSSNVGRFKHVYRQGLSQRYGRAMQIIAGVHFNYSANDALWPVRQELLRGGSGGGDPSAGYFALLRNFQRLGWVIPYLFGSSPAVCKTFLRQRADGIEEFDSNTWQRPEATSLRLSDIGYRNVNQREFELSFNSLQEYADSLARATHTPFADYERLGVRVDGEYLQLNGNLLQIENESYGLVRPKQIARSGERPTHALRERGVRYVEVRALDIDPFEPLGVSEHTLRFAEALLLLCLLEDSPPIDDAEAGEIEQNKRLVINHGREPGLTLQSGGRPVQLSDWLAELLAAMRPLCALLDEGRSDGAPYAEALDRQLPLAADPSLTPSARILAEMRERGEAFFYFALRHANAQASTMRALRTPPDVERALIEEARRSRAEQAALEAADAIDFEEYLRRYFAVSDG